MTQHLSKYTDSTLLRLRTAAHEIVAKTGVDFRTAIRALELGVDSIRTIRLREQLRPLVEVHRARLGFAKSGA